MNSKIKGFAIVALSLMSLIFSSASFAEGMGGNQLELNGFIALSQGDTNSILSGNLPSTSPGISLSDMGKSDKYKGTFSSSGNGANGFGISMSFAGSEEGSSIAPMIAYKYMTENISSTLTEIDNKKNQFLVGAKFLADLGTSMAPYVAGLVGVSFDKLEGSLGDMVFANLRTKTLISEVRAGLTVYSTDKFSVGCGVSWTHKFDRKFGSTNTNYTSTPAISGLDIKTEACNVIAGMINVGVSL